MSVDQKNCIDSYTSIVKKKAERDFHTAPGKIYHAHQPIYGFLASEGVHTDPFDREQTARNFSVLKTLACLEFGSFLDVGSAEGFLAAVVRDIFKVEVIAVDLAGQAICNANRIFGLDGVSCNASRLPFQNDAFDVVHSSEVIEHLEHPFEFLVELARVARKFVILGTCEAADTHSAARLRQLLLPDVGQVGAHRSVWTPEDFFKVFGDSVVTSTQHKRISSKVRNSDPTEVFMAVCEDPPPPHRGLV